MNVVTNALHPALLQKIIRFLLHIYNTVIFLRSATLLIGHTLYKKEAAIMKVMLIVRTYNLFRFYKRKIERFFLFYKTREYFANIELKYLKIKIQ